MPRKAEAKNCAWTTFRAARLHRRDFLKSAVGGGAAALAIGLRAPRFGRLVTPVAAAIVAVGFLGLLVAMGEITSADRQLVKALGRKKDRG